MSKLFHFFVLISILCLFGCSPVLYSPIKQNVPMIEKKNDLTANVALGLSDNQINMGGGYGVGKNTAVLLNFSTFSKRKNKNSDYYGSGLDLGIGAGYFNKFSDRFLFDVYGLADWGFVRNNKKNVDTQFIKANLSKFGIQPGIHFVYNLVSISMSLRTSILSYSNISGSLNYSSKDQALVLKNASNFLLFEPAITLRSVVKNIGGEVQFGLSQNISNPEFLQTKFYIAFGVYIQLNTKENKKTSE